MIRIGTAALIILVDLSAISSVGCSDEIASRPAQVELAMFASADGIPPSRFNDIVIVDEWTVCIPDTFLYRIVCGDAGWSHVTELGGGPGEGPGELKTLGPLFRADLLQPGAEVGIVDWGLQRAIVYSLRTGQVLSDFAVPFLFRTVAALTEGALPGLHERMRSDVGGLAEVDTGGSVIRDINLAASPDRPVTRTSAKFVRGRRLDSGNVIVQIQGNEFGVYSHDGELVSTFSSPPVDSGQRRPERDVEKYSDDRESRFGRPTAEQVEEYRTSPPPPIISETNLRPGPDETLWMATRRDDSHSYLAVFDGSELLSEIRVRNRLLGFDIRGDVLVTLVERPYKDEEGLHVLGLDWYRIKT